MHNYFYRPQGKAMCSQASVNPSVHNRRHGYSVTAHPCWLLRHLLRCGRYASYWNAFLFLTLKSSKHVRFSTWLLNIQLHKRSFEPGSKVRTDRHAWKHYLPANYVCGRQKCIHNIDIERKWQLRRCFLKRIFLISF